MTYRLVKAIIPAVAILLAASPLALAGGKSERHVLPEDNLSVTLASLGAAPAAGEDTSIWVGPVDIQGRKVIWVELIDSEGEVIYSSEVAQNETHLLPDGRAIVVSPLNAPEGTLVAAKDESRVPPDAGQMVTRRVVDDQDSKTAVELVQAPPQEPSILLQVAKAGETVWHGIVAFFQGAADSVRVAWNWIVDTVAA
jgi:hypothetical protein